MAPQRAAPAPRSSAHPGAPLRAAIHEAVTGDRAAERKRLAAERAGALLAADGLLRLPETLALVGVSASTWWEGVRTHRFPAPLRISARCVAWRAADVRALLASLAQGGTP